MTFGVQGTPKWRAPEIHNPKDEWSMKSADVYSLGLVLLNMATAVYGGDMSDFDDIFDDQNLVRRDERLRQFQADLRLRALATQDVIDAKADSFGPKHIIDLTSRMLSLDPSKRPRAEQIDTELVELGGIEQVYHFPCCKKSSRFVTERMNTRLKITADERDRLAADCQKMAKRLEILEGKDETYESRIRNERKTHADNIAHLQEQLEKERAERKRLEAMIAERRPTGPRQAIPRVVSGGPQRTKSTNQSGHKRSTSSTSTQKTMAPTVAPPSTQPSYSQAAGGGSRPKETPAAPATIIPNGRVHSMISNPPSPNPEVGYALRSRPSGSRLPRAIHPATPIRSGTPVSAWRDASMTDSTQFSMASSTFSRLSSNAQSSSPEDEDITMLSTGSPEAGKVSRRRSGLGRLTREDSDILADDESPDGLGLGVQLPDESSRAVAGLTVVPVPPSTHGSSAVSSPKSTKAELESFNPTGTKRVPSLPTAKSWADVARRERRT
jgi:serine/threonine protein kinase